MSASSNARPINRPCRRWWLWIVLLLGLAGCAGGQSGSEAPIGDSGASPTGNDAGLQGCEEISDTVIDRDQTTPMGFTPRELINLASGTQRAVLDFSVSTTAGDMTELSITVTDTGEPVRLIDVEAAVDSPDAGCPDYVLVPVTVRFTTDDGRLDEPFATDLVGFQGNETGFTTSLDADTLVGTFDYASVDDAPYDQRRIVLNATYDPSGPQGRISGIGTRADGTQRTLVIADWGPPPAGETR